jgi:hypothetical protein
MSNARIESVTITGPEEGYVIRAGADARSVTVTMTDGKKVTVNADGSTATEVPGSRAVKLGADGSVDVASSSHGIRLDRVQGLQIGDNGTQVNAW